MSAKRFFGEPCIRGHGGERYISSRDCCECVAARVRRQRGAPIGDRNRSRRPLVSRGHEPVRTPIADSAFIKPLTRAQLMGGK